MVVALLRTFLGAREPLPSVSWEGTLDATKEHVKCVQIDVLFRNYTVIGDENCLYLNVYTPAILKERLLPVIVFIHGGGFIQGTAQSKVWGPDLILDKDVILVTMNYRLGALGFLSTGDDILPGNNGLKDQSLALKWVKNNIREFGGNPQRITLTGQSAGGASTCYHLLSPLSKDIPYAAIAVSGVTPALWSFAQNGEAKRSAQRLAKALNCPFDSSQTMVNCMRHASAYKIMEQTLKFMVYNYEPSVLYKPVIESVSESAFLSEHPVDIIKKGNMAHIPFMTGVTTEDGAMKAAGTYNNYTLVETLDLHFNEVIPLLAHYDQVGFDTNDTSNELRKFYFNGESINNNTKSEVTDLLTDSMFFVPARILSLLYAKYSTKPVYFYLFGYKGSTSYSKRFGDPEHDYGVCHCDDMLYLIYNSFANTVPTSEDMKMTSFMTTLWYNFASTGNPTLQSNFTVWDPVATDDLEYYFIKGSENVEMRKNLFEERFQFWEKLPITNTIYES